MKRTMVRLAAFLMVTVMLFCLFACGNGDGKTEQTTQTVESERSPFVPPVITLPPLEGEPPGELIPFEPIVVKTITFTVEETLEQTRNRLVWHADGKIEYQYMAGKTGWLYEYENTAFFLDDDRSILVLPLSADAGELLCLRLDYQKKKAYPDYDLAVETKEYFKQTSVSQGKTGEKSVLPNAGRVYFSCKKDKQVVQSMDITITKEGFSGQVVRNGVTYTINATDLHIKDGVSHVEMTVGREKTMQEKAYRVALHYSPRLHIFTPIAFTCLDRHASLDVGEVDLGPTERKECCCHCRRCGELVSVRALSDGTCTPCKYCGLYAHTYGDNGDCVLCGHRHHHKWKDGVCLSCELVCEHDEVIKGCDCSICGLAGLHTAGENCRCVSCRKELHDKDENCICRTCGKTVHRYALHHGMICVDCLTLNEEEA